MPEKSISYRVVRIPEDFPARMKQLAKEEGLNPELAEFIAGKLLEMGIPEEAYKPPRR